MILSDFNFSFTGSGFSTTLTGSTGLTGSTVFWGSAGYWTKFLGMYGVKTLSPILKAVGTVKGA